MDLASLDISRSEVLKDIQIFETLSNLILLDKRNVWRFHTLAYIVARYEKHLGKAGVRAFMTVSRNVETVKGVYDGWDEDKEEIARRRENIESFVKTTFEWWGLGERKITLR